MQPQQIDSMNHKHKSVVFSYGTISVVEHNYSLPLPPMLTLRPHGARCVVQMEANKDEEIRNGIIVPDVAKNASVIGKVLAVGPGVLLDDGTRLADPDIIPG